MIRFAILVVILTTVVATKDPGDGTGKHEYREGEGRFRRNLAEAFNEFVRFLRSIFYSPESSTVNNNENNETLLATPSRDESKGNVALEGLDLLDFEKGNNDTLIVASDDDISESGEDSPEVSREQEGTDHSEDEGKKSDLDLPQARLYYETFEPFEGEPFYFKTVSAGSFKFSNDIAVTVASVSFIIVIIIL